MISMGNLRTERLILHPVDTAEAERISAGRPNGDDRWAADFPFEGDAAAATAFLRATLAHGDQHPFGYYVIIDVVSGHAIGGIGFRGQPVDRRVKIGYGLAASARGHGFAAEAARALVDLAREHGLLRVVADCLTSNVASRRTLERAGFTRTGVESDLVRYEVAP